MAATRIPRRWLAGNATATAIADGLNALFPCGERFFIRSVLHYVDRIQDRSLRGRVDAFVGQESQHARAHDAVNRGIEADGLDIDAVLARHRSASRWLEESLSPKLNLACTAASEHFTAILADAALRDGILDMVEGPMQRLLAWHAAEEIEHKAVAFDVLHVVDDSYRIRMMGLVYAILIDTAFAIWGAVSLLRQQEIGIWQIFTELARVRRHPAILRAGTVGIAQYMRLDFHPEDNDNRTLAARWFAKHGEMAAYE